VFNGRVRVGDLVAVCKLDGSHQQTKITKLSRSTACSAWTSGSVGGRHHLLAGHHDITISENRLRRREPGGDPAVAVDERRCP